MGLMDVLKGMQYGPRGQPRSGSGSGTGTGTGSGTGTGMSPITMAILGLLAYKAVRSMTRHGEPAPAGGPRPAGNGNGGSRGMSSRSRQSGDTHIDDMDIDDMDIDTAPRDADLGRGSLPSRGDLTPGAAQDQGAGGAGGNLGDLIKGALGGLLTGGTAGGIIGGGLNDFLNQMQKRGFGDTADSWVASGPNKTIPPGDLAKVLGSDQIEAMMAQSGLSRDELLDGLSKHLPEVVDRLTPEGQIPHHIPM
ncbi:MAG: DUF937 domain-containing protein [Bradyrhizobiaceae bacterium]|nr:DUF937 domain-containing protein [Bradyrhizobiaceae bacterium]